MTENTRATPADALKARLQADGRLDAHAEALVTRYEHLLAEVERTRTALAGMEPGSAEHKRASTAARGVEADAGRILRQLGETDRARRKRAVKKPSGARLSDFFRDHADACAYDLGAGSVCTCEPIPDPIEAAWPSMTPEERQDVLDAEEGAA